MWVNHYSENASFRIAPRTESTHDVNHPGFAGWRAPKCGATPYVRP